MASLKVWEPSTHRDDRNLTLSFSSILPLRKWALHLVAGIAILHLAISALFFLPRRLAPRLCVPIFRAIFRLLRMMSETSCLSKWRSDIQSALDELMKVSV